jgi:hypothetical protein
MRTLLNSWKDRFTRTKSARGENTRPTKSPSHRGLRLEPLEGRRLLSVSDGLLTHWTMDDASGVYAADRTSLGLDGTLKNGAT